MAASTKYGFTSKQTLEFVQALYTAGSVSYPRTDTRWMPADAAADLHKLLLTALPKNVQAKDLDVSQTVSTKASAHTALHVKQIVTPAGDKGKVYKLILQRCFEAMMPAHVSDRQDVWVDAAGHAFYSQLTKTTTPGWAVVSGKLNKDVLLTVKKGAAAPLSNLEQHEQQTKRPPVMTVAKLLKVMMNPVKLLENEDYDPDTMANLDDSFSGLGTPATRDSFVTSLEQKELIKPVGKNGKLIPTDKGLKHISRLESSPVTSVVTSPMLTAEWEQDLFEMEQIQDPKEAGEAMVLFNAKLDKFVTDLMGPLKDLRGVYGSASVTTCPVCGDGKLEAVNYGNGAARGSMITCSGNDKDKSKASCSIFVWGGKGKACKKITDKHVQDLVAHINAGKPHKGFRV